jgi:hypothetical protein
MVLCIKRYDLLPGSSAAALTEGRTLRGLSKNRFRLGREKYCEIQTVDNVDFVYDRLTVRTVGLKLLAGPFRPVTYCKCRPI